MVYFGWPSAHEDDAERGVRAALEIVQAVKAVRAAPPLAVRIGVATGTVVVGEVSRADNAEAKLAVGETPNLAARLQGLAGPDEVVIAPTTRRLVGDAFELSDLGAHALKGIAEPVRAWRVEAVHRPEGRFEAAHGGVALTPLVGREEEVALLLRRWRPGARRRRTGRADRRGARHRQVAVDPGAARADRGRAVHRLALPVLALSPQFRAVPHHRAARVSRRASRARTRPSRSWTRWKRMLAGGPEQRAEAAPLFAALLSLPTERYPPLKLSPQKQKEKTLEALAGQIEALARSASRC